MYYRVRLYSNKNNEIYNFLNKFFGDNFVKEVNKDYSNVLEWENIYFNPIEIANILGVFIDNKDKFAISMWVSLDEGFFINVTDDNSDKIIRYLYERYPY